MLPKQKGAKKLQSCTKNDIRKKGGEVFKKFLPKLEFKSST